MKGLNPIRIVTNLSLQVQTRDNGCSGIHVMTCLQSHDGDYHHHVDRISMKF